MIQVMKYIVDQYLKPNMDVDSVYTLLFLFFYNEDTTII